jgi:C4-dicarboxylate transporter DctM subunit
MWTVGFLVMFFGLLAAGMPIFLVLGTCAAILYLVSGQPMIGVAQNMIDQLNSTTLMALPLFVMAAAFMRRGGVAQALVDLSAAWLGGIRGSLGLVAVVSCALFAAISGSSVATALAMGTILLPAMLERGYPRGFALGVLGASGTIGVVIPPSLALILYGIVTEQSVPRLFLAGILPGLLQAGAFFLWVLYYARRKNFPAEPAMAALAAVTALIVSVGVYRGFPVSRTLNVIAEALRSAAVIMLIIATALVFGHWMTGSGIPEQLVDFAAHRGFATWEFLLTINVLLLIVGCFLEVVSTLLLVMPILAPVLLPLGVDPVHFGIIFTHNMEVGLVHPPVGLNLYVLSTISDAPVGEVIRGILPFLILLLIVLGIITYVPELTLWLPRMVYGS